MNTCVGRERVCFGGVDVTVIALKQLANRCIMVMGFTEIRVNGKLPRRKEDMAQHSLRLENEIYALKAYRQKDLRYKCLNETPKSC